MPPHPVHQKYQPTPILFYEPGRQVQNFESLDQRIGSLFYPSFHVAR